MSLEEALLTFTTQILKVSVKEFVDTVNRIGITGDDLTQWTGTFKTEFETFMKAIVNDAKSHEHKYTKIIDNNFVEIKKYCHLLGRSYEELNYTPTNLFNDVEQTERILAELQTSYAHYAKELEELQQQNHELRRSLCIDETHESATTLPVKDKIAELQKNNEKLENLQFIRTEEFLQLKYECIDLAKQLQFKASNGFEENVLEGADSDFILSERNLIKLKKMHDVLKEEYDILNQEVLEKKEKLIRLWDLLEEDGSRYDNIFQDCNGNYQQFLKDLNMELERCEKLKIDRIKVFITSLRSQIEVLWSKCKIPIQEQLNFTCFYSDEVTSDILEILDNKQAELNQLYLNNKSIYDNLEKYDQAYHKLQAIIKKPLDSNRLKNRGGQLLQEERDRKHLIKRLITLESIIKTACKEQDLYFGSEDIEQYFARTYNQNMIKMQRSPDVSSATMSQLASFRFTPLQSITLNVPKPSSVMTKTSCAKRNLPTRKQNISHTAPVAITGISKTKLRYSIHKKKRMEKLRRTLHLEQIPK